MLKQLTFSLMAAAALSLGLTSCSSDDPEMITGQDGNVSFTIQLPADMASRAATPWGTGVTATTLDCYVYCNGQKVAEKLNEQINITAQVSFNLANGRDYDFVFYAHNAAAPYTYDATTQELAMNYTTTMAADDESLDAFYNHASLRVTGPITQTIKLYRPFAQINVGTDDYDTTNPALNIADLAVGMTVDTAVSSSINLLTDQRSAATTTVAFQPTLVADPNAATPYDIAADQAFPYKPTVYKYICMNYLLVPQDESLINLKLKVNGTGTNNEITMDNIPVQANFRTNIYGSLLSSQVTWNVEIQPIFDGEYDEIQGAQAPDFTVSANMTADDYTQLKNALKQGCDNVLVPAGVTLNLDQLISGSANYIYAMGNVNLNVEGTLTSSTGSFFVNTGVTCNINMAPGAEYVITNPTNHAIWSKGDLNINNGTIKFNGSYTPSGTTKNLIYATAGNLSIKNTTIEPGNMMAIQSKPGNNAAVNINLENVNIKTTASTSAIALQGATTGTLKGCNINTDVTGEGNVLVHGTSNITFEDCVIYGGYLKYSDGTQGTEGVPAVTVSGSAQVTFLSGSYYLRDNYTSTTTAAVDMNYQADANAAVILKGGIFQNQATHTTYNGSTMSSTLIAPFTGFQWKAIPNSNHLFEVVPATSSARRR